MNEADKYLAARNKPTAERLADNATGLENIAASGGINQKHYEMGHALPVGLGDKGILAGLALLSGLFAIVSAIIRQLTIGMPDLLSAVMVAPPVEEILKIAIPIMVLEHRAHWLSRGKDLVWFAIGSALVFSVVENLLYMFVYLENPSAELLLWRWTACTAMHVSATALSGVGLMRAYERGLRTNQKPRFAWEWRWLVGAIAVHMAYNAYAISSVPF